MSRFPFNKPSGPWILIRKKILIPPLDIRGLEGCCYGSCAQAMDYVFIMLGGALPYTGSETQPNSALLSHGALEYSPGIAIALKFLWFWSMAGFEYRCLRSSREVEGDTESSFSLPLTSHRFYPHSFGVFQPTDKVFKSQQQQETKHLHLTTTASTKEMTVSHPRVPPSGFVR